MTRFCELKCWYDIIYLCRSNYRMGPMKQKVKSFDYFSESPIRRTLLGLIRTFVHEHSIRSVKEYRNAVRAQRSSTNFRLPLKPNQSLGLSWKLLLFGGEKYLPFQRVENYLVTNQIFTKSAYANIPTAVKRAEKLPSTLSAYPEFVGWGRFKRSRTPTLSVLKTICFNHDIRTKAQYESLSELNLVDGFLLPRDPKYLYGKKWSGWNSLLVTPTTRELYDKRIALLKSRIQKRRQLQSEVAA